MDNSLTVDVFTSDYKPIPSPPGWDGPAPPTWPASTATLISAGRTAVLVDALITTGEGERLAAWIRDRDKQVREIIVTHGHGDHFFGAGPVLAAFPGARLVAGDPRIAEEARRQTTPERIASWNGWLPGQFDQSPAVPEPVDPVVDLAGHTIAIRTIGGADGALASVVHVPELRLVCSGDIAYNNIHMWLWKSTTDSRKAWLASLDAVADLQPATIITGHRDPGAPDDEAVRVIDQSRRYLEDFDHVVSISDSPRAVFDAMMARYPAYGNPYTLYAAAFTQFP